jgi:hypothetical protein
MNNQINAFGAPIPTAPFITEEEKQAMIERDRKPLLIDFEECKKESLEDLTKFFKIVSGNLNDNDFELLNRLLKSRINGLVCGCDNIFTADCYGDNSNGCNMGHVCPYAQVEKPKEYEFLKEFTFDKDSFNTLREYGLPYFIMPNGEEGTYWIEYHPIEFD